METKFTKGRWELDRDFIYTELSEVICDIDPIGVSKKVFTRSKEEAISNAKLIAAAPELLTRLNRLVLSVKAHPDYQFGEEGDEWHDIVELAEETIKKSTE